MKTHDFIQGSADWLAHRAQHFNASDAPAMMNCSPYETRQQLIHRLKTGIGREVDAATQRRFDDGHRFEALARPMAEEIVGEDLYPVTGTEGELSASFDGLTMAEDVAFEHKSLNRDLRTVMVDGCMGTDLPLMYRVQMEQQCMVSGAGRVLFMATRWEEISESEWSCKEERHCWYESSQHLADDIAAGWRQLAEDLAAYVPAAPAEPTPQAKAREALPALVIEARGEITAGNLDEYKAHALSVLNDIPAKPKTDQEFADAKEDAKFCRDVQSAMEQAKALVLGRMTSVDDAIKAIDHIGEVARRKAIDLEGAVEAEEKRRKQQMVIDAATALREHIDYLNARLGKQLMPVIAADFAAAIKGKRNVESMQNGVNSELARAKIEANRIADQIDANLKAINAAEPATLFPDVQALVLKAPDDLAAVIASRIAAHKAAEDAKAAAVAPAPAPAAAPAVISMPARTTNVPMTAPTLSLGQISARLGFAVTADFLRTIGFEPAGRQRAAVLYHECQFTHICAALVEHIQSIQALQAA